MNLWKVLGALVSPNGMTKHSYEPYRVLKAVFHSWPSAILILLNPFLRSIFVYTFALEACSSNSFINGNGYLSLIVIAFSPLKSTTKRNPRPWGLGTKKQEAAAALLEGLILPCSPIS